MYCKKCGKFIGSDADLCDECKRAEDAARANAYQSNPYNNDYYKPPIIIQNTSAINLGKAITSIIMAMIGFVFVYAGLITIWEPDVAIVCMVIGIVPTLLGFIFGIMSIINFRQTSFIRSGKRIPLLILGISSVIESAISMFLCFMIVVLAGLM